MSPTEKTTKKFVAVSKDKKNLGETNYNVGAGPKKPSGDKSAMVKSVYKNGK